MIDKSLSQIQDEQEGVKARRQTSHHQVGQRDATLYGGSTWIEPWSYGSEGRYGAGGSDIAYNLARARVMDKLDELRDSGVDVSDYQITISPYNSTVTVRDRRPGKETGTFDMPETPRSLNIRDILSPVVHEALNEVEANRPPSELLEYAKAAGSTLGDFITKPIPGSVESRDAVGRGVRAAAGATAGAARSGIATLGRLGRGAASGFMDSFTDGYEPTPRNPYARR